MCNLYRNASPSLCLYKSRCLHIRSSKYHIGRLHIDRTYCLLISILKCYIYLLFSPYQLVLLIIMVTYESSSSLTIVASWRRVRTPRHEFRSRILKQWWRRLLGSSGKGLGQPSRWRLPPAPQSSNFAGEDEGRPLTAHVVHSPSERAGNHS